MKLYKQEKRPFKEGDEKTVWARISEILLGIWILVSHSLFAMTGWQGIASGILIILFASLSFIEKLNKLHLLQVIPSAWLLYQAYSYPTYILPFGYQNYILTSLTLLMFAVIPSHASDHPRPWKQFMKKGSKE